MKYRELKNIYTFQFSCFAIIFLVIFRPRPWLNCSASNYRRINELEMTWKSESKLLYDWWFKANQFVLATSTLRLMTSILIFQLNTSGYSPYVTSCLTRGWVCSLQLLLILAYAIIFRSESRGTRDHILLSQIRDSLKLEVVVAYSRYCSCICLNVILNSTLELRIFCVPAEILTKNFPITSEGNYGFTFKFGVFSGRSLLKLVMGFMKMNLLHMFLCTDTLETN
jgi:hypothetical protein